MNKVLSGSTTSIATHKPKKLCNHTLYSKASLLCSRLTTYQLLPPEYLTGMVNSRWPKETQSYTINLPCLQKCLICLPTVATRNSGDTLNFFLSLTPHIQLPSPVASHLLTISDPSRFHAMIAKLVPVLSQVIYCKNLSFLIFKSPPSSTSNNVCALKFHTAPISNKGSFLKK